MTEEKTNDAPQCEGCGHHWHGLPCSTVVRESTSSPIVPCPCSTSFVDNSAKVDALVSDMQAIHDWAPGGITWHGSVTGRFKSSTPNLEEIPRT